MAQEKTYKKLIAWQLANQLAKEIFKVTQSFPPQQIHGVVSQIRRSSLSVALNIVEGLARKSPRENKHFLSIALGSLAETEYLLEFCRDVGLLSESDYHKLEAVREEAGRVIWGYHNSL